MRCFKGTVQQEKQEPKLKLLLLASPAQSGYRHNDPVTPLPSFGDQNRQVVPQCARIFASLRLAALPSRCYLPEAICLLS